MIQAFPSATDLRYFLEVVSTRNLSRAAERLGVTQPTLTISMQKLEIAVGAKLFHRERTGIRLTPAGLRVSRMTEQLLELWSGIRAEALQEENEMRGCFRLGCHPSVALYTLVSFLPELYRAQPGIEIILQHRDLSRHIVEDVISDRLDLAIVINPVEHPDLVIIPLGTDRVTLWEASDGETPDTLICNSEMTQTREILKGLKKTGFTYSRILHSDRLEVIAALTASGMGYGILPERVARIQSGERLRKARVRKAQLPEFLDRLCLVYRQGTLSSVAGKFLVGRIKAMVK